jgi:hypothetical protein
LARSKGDRRVPASTSPQAPPPSVPSLASATLPRVWQEVGYRPLPDAEAARALFDFAAVPMPGPTDVALAWGAWTRDADASTPARQAGEVLIGAVLGERAERALMLHGPVIVTARDALEVAAQLAAAALDHARALSVETVFTRPGGLDRIWVRFGFIPVPESALPAALAGRPGAGLYAWRGGTALWTFREATRD